jgi:sulfhydrogenase subunit beta (sulfur reductase)
MPEIRLEVGATVALPKEELDDLLTTLKQTGYQTFGPSVKDGVIVYGELTNTEDLPLGYANQQEAGKFRLVEVGNGNYFDSTPGAQSWKQYFFPPRSRLFKLSKDNGKWKAEMETESKSSLALIGVRPCELAAIQVQDRVFLRDDWNDPLYRRQRQSAFIMAVECLKPCDTCFCASLGTGPGVEDGFDLRFTELEDVFLVKIGSEAGRMMVNNLKWRPASAFWLTSAQRGLDEARQSMRRSLPNSEALPELLLNNLEANHWDDVAKRCMSCTNCTLVCPTCFCWDVQDQNDLLGTTVSRERVWDSCFNPEYSHVFGGNTRPNTRSRYRQWLTHKLGSWQQQFGVLGCVGCGRCITWCPAGIDITEEVAALREEVQG